MLGKHRPVMFLFPRLPKTVTPKALRKFIETGLRDRQIGAFSFLSAVRDCTIVCVSDLASGSAEHHGMVEIRPSRGSLAALEDLKGQELQGKKVEIHRYRPCSRGHDPWCGLDDAGDHPRPFKIELMRA